MLSASRKISVPIALTLALLAGPALAGCSVQGIVNNVTGGKVTLPDKSVPTDFPKSVPLAKGTVVLGGAVGDGKGGKVWNVTIEAADATINSITTGLTGAGFTANGSVSPSAEGGTATFDNGTYSVIVVVAKSDGKVTVNYTVATDAKK